jgi:hypothetical protein
MGNLSLLDVVPENGVHFLVLFLVGTAICVSVANVIADKWFRQ